MKRKLINTSLTLFVMTLTSGLANAAVRDLGTLGGTYSFARDINDHGEVVGESTTLKGETHAFFWSGDGLVERQLFPSYRFSMANGMNNLGQAVGYMRTSAKTGLAKAILWEKDGTAVILPNLKGQSYSQGSDLNDAGDIAGVSGTKAVLWKKRKATALKSLDGDYSIALGINSKSWVVGNSLTASGEVHASLWHDGKVVDLGTLGGRFSTANSINDRDQIVGSSETADGNVHAFVWEDGKMKDLGAGMVRALNADGILVGESPNPSVEGEEVFSHSVVWGEAFKVSALTILPDAKYSSAFGINGSGTIIGVTEFFNRLDKETDESAAGQFHATIWESDFARGE